MATRARVSELVKKLPQYQERPNNLWNIKIMLTLIVLLSILSTYLIINQFEAFAYVQCGDDLPNSIYPIEDGEQLMSGSIKLTSFIQNTANLYEPKLLTYHADTMNYDYESYSSYVGYSRGKCIIDIASNWDYR